MRSINEAYTDVNDYKTMMNRITQGEQQQLESLKRVMFPQPSGNRSERRQQERMNRRAAKRMETHEP